MENLIEDLHIPFLLPLPNRMHPSRLRTPAPGDSTSVAALLQAVSAGFLSGLGFFFFFLFFFLKRRACSIIRFLAARPGIPRSSTEYVGVWALQKAPQVTPTSRCLSYLSFFYSFKYSLLITLLQLSHFPPLLPSTQHIPSPRIPLL